MKTNALRILDKHKINYITHSYDSSLALSGTEIALALNENPAHVFKTLVTTGKSGTHYVFMIPVAEELDLKKAALAVHEKNIEMLKQKDLLPLTGYIHGGCSPIGMKKQFKTVIHKTAEDLPNIMFSAGTVGLQTETTFKELASVIEITIADIIVT